MIYDYDFNNKWVEIPWALKDSVLVIDLLSDIRLAEATEQGITYGQIASASGKESLGGEVAVGVTVQLLDDWQVVFPAGNYIATISGGNLVGGLLGNPVAYVAGVQILNIQSAASTVVSTSTGVSTSDRALLETAAAKATAAEKMLKNDAVTNTAGTQSTVYDDDGVTPYHIFNHPTSKERRGA